MQQYTGKMSQTQLRDFAFDFFRLSVRSSSLISSHTQFLPDQSHGSGSDQGLQAVWVTAESPKHPKAPATGVVVLGEVVQEPRENAGVDECRAGVWGMREAGQQQENGGFWGPDFRVIWVMIDWGF